MNVSKPHPMPKLPLTPRSGVNTKVWIYARRHSTADRRATCDLCSSLPTPKRIPSIEGATSTLRKHWVKVHKKIELLLT